LAFGVSTGLGELVDANGADSNDGSAPAGGVVAVPQPAIATTATIRAAAIVEVVARRRVEDIAGNGTRPDFDVAERLRSVLKRARAARHAARATRACRPGRPGVPPGRPAAATGPYRAASSNADRASA
jgi:hypothetical protein